MLIRYGRSKVNVNGSATSNLSFTHDIHPGKGNNLTLPDAAENCLGLGVQSSFPPGLHVNFSLCQILKNSDGSIILNSTEFTFLDFFSRSIPSTRGRKYSP